MFFCTIIILFCLNSHRTSTMNSNKNFEKQLEQVEVIHETMLIDSIFFKGRHQEEINQTKIYLDRKFYFNPRSIRLAKYENYTITHDQTHHSTTFTIVSNIDTILEMQRYELKVIDHINDESSGIYIHLNCQNYIEAFNTMQEIMIVLQTKGNDISL